MIGTNLDESSWSWIQDQKSHKQQEKNPMNITYTNIQTDPSNPVLSSSLILMSWPLQENLNEDINIWLKHDLFASKLYSLPVSQHWNCGHEYKGHESC